MKKETVSQVRELEQDLKDQFKVPSPMAASKAPSGKGNSKNDLLVQRLALEFKHDPVAELVKLAQSNRIPPELKAKINMEFLQYYLPKLKAIDTNPNQGEVININIVQPSLPASQAQVITLNERDYRNVT